MTIRSLLFLLSFLCFHHQLSAADPNPAGPTKSGANSFSTNAPRRSVAPASRTLYTHVARLSVDGMTENIVDVHQNHYKADPELIKKELRLYALRCSINNQGKLDLEAASEHLRKQGIIADLALDPEGKIINRLGNASNVSHLLAATQDGNCTAQMTCTSQAGCTSGTCTTGNCTAEGTNCTSHASCTAGGDCTKGDSCTLGNKCTEDTLCTLGGAAGGCTSGPMCTYGGGDECTAGDKCTAGQKCTGGDGCTVGNACTGAYYCTAGDLCTDGDTCTTNKCTDKFLVCTWGRECTTGPKCTSQGNENCTDGSGCTYMIWCNKLEEIVVMDTTIDSNRSMLALRGMMTPVNLMFCMTIVGLSFVCMGRRQ